MVELQESIERVMAGPQRKSKKVSDKEKKIVEMTKEVTELLAKNGRTERILTVNEDKIIDLMKQLGYVEKDSSQYLDLSFLDQACKVEAR